MRQPLVSAALLCALVALSSAAAQGSDAIATSPLGATPAEHVVPQPSDSLYREGTRALTKGDNKRAVELFSQLRVEYPRSPYAPDSYYWEAFALQRMETTRSMQRALVVLDEQRLRFPDAATTEDVIALRTRIEGVLSRELAAERASAAAQLDRCGAKDDSLALTSLIVLTALTDPESIRSYLASLLAQRAPCARELRLGAVHLLGQRPEAPSKRMLAQVAESDPDELVRAAARRLLSAPRPTTTDEVRNARPALRMTDDTLAHMVGDSVLAPARIIRWDRNTERVTIQMAKPGQLIVMSVVPGKPIELLEPSSPGTARTIASGTVTLSLRRTQLVATGGANDSDALAYQLRIDAEMEACVARKTAEIQAQIDREWARRADKSNKPVVQQPTGARADVLNGASMRVNAGVIGCSQRTSRIAPAPPTRSATTTVDGALRDGDDRYLLVLTTARPLTFTHLVVRLGTIIPAAVTTREMFESIAQAVFDGKTSGWSGSWIGW